MTTNRDLVITRDIAVPREKLYRCWTEPELIKQWFTPKPWTTPHAETDVRPGGASLVMMRGPDGQEIPNPAVYLEVVPNERLVATDAYWTEADREAHEKMGFAEGWGQATKQLAELAARL